MKFLPKHNQWRIWSAVSASLLMAATLGMAVTPNNKSFTAGEKGQLKGVIISHEGDVLKVRGDDDSIATVDLSGDTKVQLKHGIFGRKTAMEISALVPGLHIEAQGKGNDKGDLQAERVIFDPNSMRASRQIDARVSPLEGRTGSLEGRTGQLEGRANTLDSRTGALEGQEKTLEATEKQTLTQVGQAQSAADQANQGVNTVNGRVTNLDNYSPKETATVYFKVGSAVLSPQAKSDLDNLAMQAVSEKGYVVEIAGYADTTGNAALNQALSQRRADAVIQYLEEKGNIPIHRILTPTGLGTSHEAADNKTAAGRKLNRRVEVKVLVNQGLVASGVSGQTSTPPPQSTSPTPPQQ
jgi:outer membrane protein OmpA-like peptidoglycan-associated protein